MLKKVENFFFSTGPGVPFFLAKIHDDFFKLKNCSILFFTVSFTLFHHIGCFHNMLKKVEKVFFDRAGGVAFFVQGRGCRFFCTGPGVSFFLAKIHDDFFNQKTALYSFAQPPSHYSNI